MPAADLINAREIDRIVADFRSCREHGYERNCESYARRRLVQRHPTEHGNTINNVMDHARSAMQFGAGANRSGPNSVITGRRDYSPADTQYNAGNRSPVGYRYGTSVEVHVGGGPNAGRTFQIRVVVTSSTALTRQEIEQEAIREGERRADSMLKNSPGMEESDLSLTANVRIDSAYQSR